MYTMYIGIGIFSCVRVRPCIPSVLHFSRGVGFSAFAPSVSSTTDVI